MNDTALSFAVCHALLRAFETASKQRMSDIAIHYSEKDSAVRVSGRMTDGQYRSTTINIATSIPPENEAGGADKT